MKGLNLQLSKISKPRETNGFIFFCPQNSQFCIKSLVLSPSLHYLLPNFELLDHYDTTHTITAQQGY